MSAKALQGLADWFQGSAVGIHDDPKTYLANTDAIGPGTEDCLADRIAVAAHTLEATGYRFGAALPSLTKSEPDDLNRVFYLIREQALNLAIPALALARVMDEAIRASEEA